jgi:hypothetical protein
MSGLPFFAVLAGQIGKQRACGNRVRAAMVKSALPIMVNFASPSILKIG